MIITSFNSIEDAWQEYVAARYEGRPISASQYHSDRLAFLSGAMGGMNMMVTRVRQIEDPRERGRAVIKMTTALLHAIIEEYRKHHHIKESK